MNRQTKSVRRITSKSQRLVPMGGDGDTLVKRLTFPAAGIVSSAGGVIALTTDDDSIVESAPASEWASFAARYQQYRVRAMRILAKPAVPVNTATVTHGEIYVSDFIGSSAPSSAAQVLSDERNKIFSTSKAFTYEVDWSRNPNAKLWNPTSASIPVANRFGIAYASNPNYAGLSASTTYFSFSYEWVVEFRGSQ